jgi:hypothetical protein
MPDTAALDENQHFAWNEARFRTERRANLRPRQPTCFSCRVSALAASHRRLGLGQLCSHRVDAFLELEQRAHIPGDHSEQGVVRH